MSVRIQQWRERAFHKAEVTADVGAEAGKRIRARLTALLTKLTRDEHPHHSLPAPTQRMRLNDFALFALVGRNPCVILARSPRRGRRV